MGTARLRWALPVVAVLLPACSIGSADEAEVRAGEVYSAIVQWFASNDPTDPDPLPVFVEPRGEGATIKLEVQTEVIAATEEVATVRFIDDRTEALADPLDEEDSADTTDAAATDAGTGDTTDGTTGGTAPASDDRTPDSTGTSSTDPSAPDETSDGEGEGDEEPVIRVVRDEGVLLRLAPVVEEGRRVTIDVDRYTDEVTSTTMRFSLVQRDGGWRVEGSPERIPSEG